MSWLNNSNLRESQKLVSYFYLGNFVHLEFVFLPFLITVQKKQLLTGNSFFFTRSTIRQHELTTFNSGVVLRVAQHCRPFESANFEIMPFVRTGFRTSSRKFHRRLGSELALARRISLAILERNLYRCLKEENQSPRDPTERLHKTIAKDYATAQ